MSRSIHMCRGRALTLPGCGECDDLRSKVEHLETEVAGKISSDQLIAGDHIHIDVDENGVTISSEMTKEEILTMLGYDAIELSKTNSDGVVTTVEVLGKVTTSSVEPPTFTGVNDVTINQGSTFDPNAGVHASDHNGTSVPFTVTGTVDTSTTGDYTLTYTATDSLGLTATATRTVSVIGAHTTTTLFDGWYGCSGTQDITQEEYDRVYNAVTDNDHCTVTALVANDEQLDDIVWEGNLWIYTTPDTRSGVYKTDHGITIKIYGIDGYDSGSFQYSDSLEKTICFGSAWYFHIEANAIGG